MNTAKTSAALLLLLGAAVAALLAAGQAPFANSKYEWGEYREYSGVIEAEPYPILFESPAFFTGGDARRPFLLVAPGKHGLTGVERGKVRLSGALIQRDGTSMLEVQPGSLAREAGPARQDHSPLSLGTVTLSGEIVDSKCYLGVMNPGQGKVHRDCAARCISGGIPPAFLARDAAGKSRVLLLTGDMDFREHAGEPVELTGKLTLFSGLLILHVTSLRAD